MVVLCWRRPLDRGPVSENACLPRTTVPGARSLSPTLPLIPPDSLRQDSSQHHDERKPRSSMPLSCLPVVNAVCPNAQYGVGGRGGSSLDAYAQHVHTYGSQFALVGLRKGDAACLLYATLNTSPRQRREVTFEDTTHSAKKQAIFLWYVVREEELGLTAVHWLRKKGFAIDSKDRHLYQVNPSKRCLSTLPLPPIKHATQFSESSTPKFHKF